MAEQQEDLDKLYSAVSSKFDIGTIDEFKSKMSTTEDRKKFYDVVNGKGLDIGSYDDYEKRLATPTVKTQKFTGTFSQPKPEVPTMLIGDAKKQAQEVVDKRKASLNKAVEVYKSTHGGKLPDTKTKETGGTGGLGTALGIGAAKFNEGVFKIPRYIYDVAAIPQNIVADFTNTPELRADYDEISEGKYNPLGFIDRLGDWAKNEGEVLQREMPKYEKGVSESLKDGNYALAGEQVLNNVVQSVPSIVSMYLTGGAGNAAGLGNIGKTLLTALPFASQKNSELQDNKDVPEYIKPINATLNGLAEVVFEQEFGTKAILDNVLNTFEREGRDAAVAAAKDFTSSYITKAIKKVQPVTSTLKNSIEEMATQFSQNLIDKNTIDPDRDLMQNVLDAGIIGGATGAGISTIGGVSAGIFNSKQKAKLEQEVSNRNDIVNDLDNETLPETAKAELLNQLEKSNDRISKLTDEAEKNVETLPEKEREQAQNIQSEISEIETSLQDENISDTTRELLTKKYEGLQEKLDVLSETSKILTDEQGQQTTVVEESQPEDLLIEDEIPAPTPTRLQEIQSKRQEIKDRISEKFKQQRGQLSSGIDPTLLKDYIELGANYIEEGVVRFSDFAKKIKEDLPSVPLEDKDIREIFTQAAQEKGFKVRGFTESVKNAKNLSEETKATVEDLNTLYEVQDYNEIYDRLANTSEVDKVKAVKDLEKVTESLTSKDNVGVLAGIQLINQYNAEGKTEEAKGIIDSLMKVGTVAAQTLRQFGELKKSTVDGFIQIINSRLEKSGKKLTPEQEIEVKRLWDIIKANNEAKIQAEETLYNTLDKQDRKAVREATIKLEDAQRELDDYIGEIKGSDIYDTLSSIMQGNLLTLKSVIQNPISNTVQALVDNYENLLSIPVDMALGLYTKQRSRFPRINKDNLRNQQFAIEDGIRSATRKAIKGSTNTELSKYDVGNRLRPFEAVKRLLFKSKRGDNYSSEQALSDFFEGTTGQFANFFFRTLPFGDDPFTAFGRQNELNRIAKSKGLEGEAYDRFILKPDPKSLELADRASKKQTFQEDNDISRAFNYFRNIVENKGSNRHVRGFAKIALKGIAPFVKTPSSVLIKTLDFAVPVLPLYRFISNLNKLHTAKKGKASPETINQLQSKASLALATTIVAVTANQAAQYIVSNALATGSAPDDPRDKKRKDFMYLTQPPNTVNISGLQRLLKGEDPKYQQNDKVASYNSLGVLGAVIGITENTRGKALRETERKKDVKTTKGEDFYELDDAEKGAVNDYVTGLFSNIGASGQFLMDQAFLQGTSTVIESLATGDYRKIVPQFSKTLSNIGLPNQVAQGFRASDKELRDLYTEDVWESTANVLKERYQGIDDLPKKINMWGQPIKSTPEGENPIVFQVFDLFRTQRILKDQTTYKIFDILKKINDEQVLPASIKDSYKSGEFTTKLTPEEESKLAEFVGKERKLKADRVMSSYNPNEIADVTQIKRVVERLKKAYESGASIGKRKFKNYLKTR